MKYKVIIKNKIAKGQVLTFIKEYTNRQDAEEFLKIIKNIKYDSVKLVKEYTAQEVLYERMSVQKLR